VEEAGVVAVDDPTSAIPSITACCAPCSSAQRREARITAAAPSVVGVQSSVPSGSATRGAAMTCSGVNRRAVVGQRVARGVLVGFLTATPARSASVVS